MGGGHESSAAWGKKIKGAEAYTRQAKKTLCYPVEREEIEVIRLAASETTAKIQKVRTDVT